MQSLTRSSRFHVQLKIGECRSYIYVNTIPCPFSLLLFVQWSKTIVFGQGFVEALLRRCQCVITADHKKEIPFSRNKECVWVAFDYYSCDGRFV